MSQPDRPPVPAPRAPHLMDPANPRPAPRAGWRWAPVQRWVMSVLAVTTIGHFAAGLVLAAVFMDGADQVARVGLVVIAGVVGVLGVAAGFLIHQRSAADAVAGARPAPAASSGSARPLSRARRPATGAGRAQPAAMSEGCRPAA